MGDYANYGRDLFKAAGIVYIAICLAALLLALWLPKSAWGKVITASVVLALALILPLQLRQEAAQTQVKVDAAKARYEKAKALFDERCKTAGEKIHRTVQDVTTVEIVDTRGKFAISNFADQNWKYAGFPGESNGSQYIAEFLYFHKPSEGNYGRSLGRNPKGLRGYRTVAVAEDGEISQYKLLEPENYLNVSDPLEATARKEVVNARQIRFAIQYEDISKPEDRANWVAGGRVSVIDRKDNSLLGEFIRYAFEPGFGNTGGGRSPWDFAKQCPLTNYGLRDGHIRSFVEQVLIPKQGN
jgi:hypothetical protein